MSEVNQEEVYTQDEVDSKKAEKTTRENKVKNINDKISQLESARKRIKDNMDDIKELKKDIEDCYEYLDDMGDWAGNQKKEVHDIAEYYIYTDCENYHNNLDACHDAICDKIQDLIKERTGEENIIEKLGSYIQMAIKEIEEVVS